jgi:hypothetical protein
VITVSSKRAAIPGLVVIAVCAVVLSAYSGASTPEGHAPTQPIAFPHPRHVGTLGMNCVYCHFAGYKAPDIGMPALSTCMGCHAIIGAGGQLMAQPGRPARPSPELKKLQGYWNASDPTKSRPIAWVRVHKVPEYVHFPHVRHVNAGVTCQTCHGPVQTMSVVYQYSSLNMGWCINCHVNGYSIAEGKRAAGLTPTQADLAAPRVRARYDCAVCHY